MVRVCALMAGILALGLSVAAAEDSSRVAKARSHFLAGKLAYRAAHYEQALKEFESGLADPRFTRYGRVVLVRAIRRTWQCIFAALAAYGSLLSRLPRPAATQQRDAPDRAT